MNQEQFLQFHRETVDKMHEICRAKNSDYCGGESNNNAFANFELIEVFGVTTTEVGLFTRLLDKMSRIASYLKQGSLQVVNESVIDTLLDAANYCILLAAYLQSKSENK
jgi:hypothetical protein